MVTFFIHIDITKVVKFVQVPESKLFRMKGHNIKNLSVETGQGLQEGDRDFQGWKEMSGQV